MTSGTDKPNQQAATLAADPVATAIGAHRHRQGPLLPILHDIQRDLGCIPKSAVAEIAAALNLSRAEVHGVVTFYHSFTTEPQGKHVIEVCRAESCQAMGGREIEAAFQQQLGLDWGDTSADQQITLEPVYCLGNCGCSPAIRIGKDIHGRVNSADVSTLISKLREG